MKDNLAICKELIDLIKKSPKREASLKNAKMVDFDTTPGIRTLCPTRWTVDSLGNKTRFLKQVGEL